MERLRSSPQFCRANRGGRNLELKRSRMALSGLRCCLLMATVALIITGVSARREPPAAAPWTPPINAFANAPIHSHTWGPPSEPGGPTPRWPRTTTTLPLHPAPYPFFHTLPYPLPRPLLCPGFSYPPYFLVDPYGRLVPPKDLYQNIGRPLPFFPLPFSVHCFPFPQSLPLPRPRPLPLPRPVPNEIAPSPQ